MKLVILGLAASLVSFSALAEQSSCVKKQITAAKKAMSRELGVPATSVKFVSFKNGPYTEAVGDNYGSDDITVSYESVVGTYTVSVKQIGMTADCKVLSVK